MRRDVRRELMELIGAREGALRYCSMIFSSDQTITQSETPDKSISQRKTSSNNERFGVVSMLVKFKSTLKSVKPVQLSIRSMLIECIISISVRKRPKVSERLMSVVPIS